MNKHEKTILDHVPNCTELLRLDQDLELIAQAFTDFKSRITFRDSEIEQLNKLLVEKDLIIKRYLEKEGEK